jgi:hypothetical protein
MHKIGVYFSNMYLILDVVFARHYENIRFVVKCVISSSFLMLCFGELVRFTDFFSFG